MIREGKAWGSADVLHLPVDTTLRKGPRHDASSVAFVARRLGAESLGLVFGARLPSSDLAGLPELMVAGLREEDARALLDSVLTGPLDPRVRDQIIAETRGNPLALLELPRGLTAAELAGGFGLPAAVPLSGSIEDSFRRRMMPASARSDSLTAAALGKAFATSGSSSTTFVPCV